MIRTIVQTLTQKVEKKYRFATHAVFYATILYAHNSGFIPLENLWLYFTMLFVTSASVILVHYPNVTYKNIFMAVLLPMNLALGGTLSLLLFPNISLLFRFAAIIVFSLLDYIILLIDNIFLVIEGREELIPLYRVAVTWSLILQIIVFIPFVAAIYKFNVNSYYHAAVVAVAAFFYSLYQIWVTRYDKDAKNVGVVERIFLSFIVFFLVFAGVIGVSFVPSEPFLKALFTASVAMFGLSYVSAYLKNEINKKFIFQYAFITVFFLVLMMIFRP
ncbi:hypothetical protein A2473_03795 [candidate division WWE3 bacterium RIFOXYC2_FULL_42_13]|uniref:Uncharacterized protein n=1 Tax=candidate division WWE3 bacterium TaxID=2053526 RepID=A0A3D0ZQX8_UNCKA|nr:MAG: hypothetical protein A2245_04320 [candidate division WWE3 bacterium RIFOXYA2_FULL_43_12]OGC65599.1 MAG: hypothetical protein A2274_02675 [candidate division WWE3 bacterium RIFOXYA12_FULL_43_11]OGC71608.1 MAG: hypothetical protein A2337_01575 [candidate division WWE3 bacterium RIFOXYB2_FULL_43_9]OGC72842.1 MAG: hypothetical protein A2473_03795 [candidate division WWE3 bacterium RIFOXYC2_FULL_42_13]OGC74624.1 MAG: hypothetical protein A2547_03690 [candidate division WWE3 bacterium RIFOXYD